MRNNFTSFVNVCLPAKSIVSVPKWLVQGASSVKRNFYFNIRTIIYLAHDVIEVLDQLDGATLTVDMRRDRKPGFHFPDVQLS